jgi:hypothetical protein
MNQLALVDLDNSQALAHQAMCDLTGGGDRQLISSSTVYGPWSEYQRLFRQDVYLTTHDNYKAVHSYEGFKRSRTLTEYSYWLHTVRV